MLYKVLAAAFLVASGDALRVDPSGMSRRAVIGAAAAVLPLAPLAAFAELKQASDADVYQRADEGKLNAARVIERAKKGELVDGSSATCDELQTLLSIDKEALVFEKEKLAALNVEGAYKLQKKQVADAQDMIELQIKKLEERRVAKNCPPPTFKKASDKAVYERADEGKLTVARVIERAKRGELVDGSSASCSELANLIDTDEKAIKFENNKLDAIADGDASEYAIVKDAKESIQEQLVKLKELKKKRKCNY